MSDRIAVINQGRVMQSGEPRKIYEHPVNKFVADFIGDSTFLPVTMSSGRVMYRDTVLDTAVMPDETGNALLMLRPERLQIVTDQACEAMNRFTGTVRGIIYQGDSYLLQVELADDLEVCVCGANQRHAMASVPEPGSAITLGLHRDDTVLVSDE